MFGERLRELRKQKKLTMKELGKIFNLAESTISGYESGTRKPDIEQIRKFADYFDVPTDYLLGRSNSLVSTTNSAPLTEKDEKDIAKRMETLKKDLSAGEGLSYKGEPMSDEAIESLLEAIEYADRQTTRVNKKYIPKKYRKDNNDS
ncbi:transcriptional regulator [Bacillus sp. J14TS2]|uniref:helix-turn-helix domain-containing protein n=1 Tax=Bacillus sp. J14TS2 TaxID=2807188 RepID=UPI001B0D05D9|nr:helix-turn-helix transcriptional regulator [Bacillus sp. J14TS2]GIN71185.1 transcriptional regulator [Bacillus sp. J14TS2]